MQNRPELKVGGREAQKVFTGMAQSAFTSSYTPEKVSELIEAVRSLNYPEKGNIWIQKKYQPQVLDPVKKRMLRKDNKEELTIIASLLTALETLRNDSLLEREELKQLRQTNLSLNQNQQNGSAKLQEELNNLTARLIELNNEIEACKYYLFTAHQLLDKIKPLSFEIPQKFRNKLAELDTFIYDLQKSQQERQIALEEQAFRNEIKGNDSFVSTSFMQLEASLAKEKNKRIINVWEKKCQQYEQLLQGLLPCFS